MADKATGRKPAESYVLIGRKPVMKYVLACLSTFNAGAEKVVVKARGRSISAAVDTAELLRRGFLKDVEVTKIEIGTQEKDLPYIDRETTVASIEITLSKK